MSDTNPLIIWGEIRCSGRVSNSCSTSAPVTWLEHEEHKWNMNTYKTWDQWRTYIIFTRKLQMTWVIISACYLTHIYRYGSSIRIIFFIWCNSTWCYIQFKFRLSNNMQVLQITCEKIKWNTKVHVEERSYHMLGPRLLHIMLSILW